MAIDEEYGSLRIPSRVYTHIEETVADLYVELNICKSPINPWSIAKRKGYIVVPYSKLKYNVVMGLRKKDLKGISFFNQTKGCFIIYYDNAYSFAIQRFTIMHEIGHILLGRKGESELANQMANYFAAYALVPSPLIDCYKCEDFIDVEAAFMVSPPCAERCFNRYLNRKEYGGKLKKYEIKLLDLYLGLL